MHQNAFDVMKNCTATSSRFIKMKINNASNDTNDKLIKIRYKILNTGPLIRMFLKI
jgi:hypothetical protein